MLMQEHVKTAEKARSLLLEAYVEFADGDDRLRACEKLWQAAAHAITAVAQQRGWECGDLNALHAAADRLSEEREDPLLASEFDIADFFRVNVDIDYMEDPQLRSNRPHVRHFVESVLSLPELSPAGDSGN